MRLSVEQLHVTQGAFTLAADFALPAQSLTAVTGASGSGKSTLLAGIAGFAEAVTGEVRIDDQPILDQPPGERPLSILFQDHNLFPHLTAFQNAALGVSPRLKLTAEMKQRVTEVLEQMGLAGFSERKPAALSGGQCARVALARTLLRARPVLLLDEPFSALDPDLRAEMLDLVQNVVKIHGLTALMVTHMPEDAAQADHHLVIENGMTKLIR